MKCSAHSWELLSYDGRMMGPFHSSDVVHAFLRGKINLESRVRLSSHLAFKPLAHYYHMLWSDHTEEGSLSRASPASASSSNASSSNSSTTTVDGLQRAMQVSDTVQVTQTPGTGANRFEAPEAVHGSMQLA